MKWQPITDIDPDAKRWMSDFYREALEEWRDLSAKLKDPDTDRTALDLWTRERNRMMAIETGQIEDLYTMRQGITEQLITEGLEHARASHTVEQGLADDTLRGLLLDQHDALEMVFQCVSDERPISESVIKEWHALLTRHQELAPGRDSQGRRIGIPFTKVPTSDGPTTPAVPMASSTSTAHRSTPRARWSTCSPCTASTRRPIRSPPRSRLRGCTTDSCRSTHSRTATGAPRDCS